MVDMPEQTSAKKLAFPNPHQLQEEKLRIFQQLNSPGNALYARIYIRDVLVRGLDTSDLKKIVLSKSPDRSFNWFYW